MDSSFNEPTSDSLDVAEKRDESPNGRSFKRRRKSNNPISLTKSKAKKTFYCKNLACWAILRREDRFCKRCSCCLCLKFDDNKDPSRWLTCNSDPPFAGESCGFSCHLECAFKCEKSGITENKPKDDDGCFYCVSCGKRNSLLECWRKQLMIVKETISVEVLCFRLLLAHSLLKNTKKYIEVYETVDKAVETLENEFSSGPLADLPSSMRRGNINRLGCSLKVKNLCYTALTMLDDLALSYKMQGSTKIRFEDIRATSLTLILGSEESASSSGHIIHHSVWHRKVADKEYSKDSTCKLFTVNTRFVVSGLTPATEYCFKVVSFSGTKELSVDEFKVSTQISSEENELTTLANCLTIFEKSNNLSPHPQTSEPDGQKVSLKIDRTEKDKTEKGSLGLEQCVKILRNLESSGYIERDFRQKFLTWFSLRATAKDINVVKVFVDVFEDDSVALAEQLVDTFSDCISKKRSPISGCSTSSGFGMKL